jgi:RNase P protein component
LREVVRLAPAETLCTGHDYVLIGRRAALAVPFSDMVRQFATALRRVHAAVAAGSGLKATGAAGKAPLDKARNGRA